MFGELIPVGGGDPIPLLKKTLLVGRRESCDICLRFANVSAHHCQFTCRGGYWYVKDMGSRNGTKINGRRIGEAEKRIDPGDTVAVAKHSYEFAYSPAALGAVGPPPPEASDNLVEEIMGRSLMERAGLNRRKIGKDQASRYDVGQDEGGKFKDPNEPI